MIPVYSEKLLVFGLLTSGYIVETTTWHALDVRGTPQALTWEVEDISFVMDIPNSREQLESVCGDMLSLPWAEKQFEERVSGEPLNPGETFREWPHQSMMGKHKPQGLFSHTYMERYWPKRATAQGPRIGNMSYHRNRGIRFNYGDLADVVNLLCKDPYTRQAYLPVFFPEDTGAVHGQRIPCSLGYLFKLREGKLNITYYIRSCDYFRHLYDDVYMTGRLCQWVIDQCKSRGLELDEISETWHEVVPGKLTMHIGSLHIFFAELPRLRIRYEELTNRHAAANSKRRSSQEHVPTQVSRGSDSQGK
jgi:hypothetical protein